MLFWVIILIICYCVFYWRPKTEDWRSKTTDNSADAIFPCRASLSGNVLKLARISQNTCYLTRSIKTEWEKCNEKNEDAKHRSALSTNRKAILNFVFSPPAPPRQETRSSPVSIRDLAEMKSNVRFEGRNDSDPPLTLRRWMKTVCV